MIITPNDIGKIQVEITKLSKDQKLSFRWLVEYLRNVKTDTTLTSRYIRPGEMRLFRYMPKGRLTLPYYDRVPLIMVISADIGSFTGINFHYLPPQYRKFVLAKILSYSDNMPSLTRMRNPFIYFNQIKNSLWKFAIKKYLVSHLTSPVYFIPKTEWAFSTNLPVAEFQKRNQEMVWVDGRKKFRV